MQCRTLLALAALGSTVACWAQSRTGRSEPAITTLNGAVSALETGEPIPHAEVCVFGNDTTCVRADARGHYRVRVRPGTVTVRFRSAGRPLAFVRQISVAGGKTMVNCAISDRLSLADEAACFAAPLR